MKKKPGPRKLSETAQTIRVSITTDSDTWQLVDVIAKRDGLSISHVVRQAIKAYCINGAKND